MFPVASAAQRVDIYARAGIAGSSPLVTDHIADARIADENHIDAAMDAEVRAVPKPGPWLGAGVLAAFWPTVRLGAEIGWSPTELEAEDGAGTRPIQDLTVLQTTIQVSWAVRQSVELGAGAGLLWYRTEDKGLFAAGSDTSPVLGVNAAWTPAFWDRRVALVGGAQTHRFGTPVLRSAGGQDGSVTSVSLTARVRLLEVGG